MTTIQLDWSEKDEYDYLIVGGGTAGCVVAARLAEYLPKKRILLIEAGPSDFMDERVLRLKDWLNLLGGALDYSYPTTEQPMGNSHIIHSRAKVLGGCSSHNTLISFWPFEYDCQQWVSQGAKGWDFETFTRLLTKLRNNIQPIVNRLRNPLMLDWVESSSKALDIPIIEDFNKHIADTGALPGCAGFFSLSYNPLDGRRSSASVAYIHPILEGKERRPNLKILTNAWVSKINVKANRAVGVDVTLQNKTRMSLTAKKETIVCGGAINTPQLMLLSGLGPKSQLSSLSIPVVEDIPGVGENLQDHPETIIFWEMNRSAPLDQTTMDSDAGIFLRREKPNAAGRKFSTNPKGIPDGDIADVMLHCFQKAYGGHTTRMGYEEPENAFCMTPNIPRPRSRGRVYLTSADPDVRPSLDFRYFTDPEGYDAATFVYGIQAARKIAEQAPFKNWLKREVAPGPHVQSYEELSEYARRAAHTVYHPAGTTKMGDIITDPLAVVDEKLRVRGVERLRIADAGVFPTLTTINPMLTVLAVGERCAELVAEEAGWRGDDILRAAL